jgi:hypothetical protein
MEGAGGQGSAPGPARERRPVHPQPRRLCLAGVPAAACFLPLGCASHAARQGLAEALRRLLRGTLSASAHPWPVASVGIAGAWSSDEHGGSKPAAREIRQAPPRAEPESFHGRDDGPGTGRADSRSTHRGASDPRSLGVRAATPEHVVPAWRGPSALVAYILQRKIGRERRTKRSLTSWLRYAAWNA